MLSCLQTRPARCARRPAAAESLGRGVAGWRGPGHTVRPPTRASQTAGSHTRPGRAHTQRAASTPCVHTAFVSTPARSRTHVARALRPRCPGAAASSRGARAVRRHALRLRQGGLQGAHALAARAGVPRRVRQPWQRAG
eukprot:5891170-Prymnesium_polylepis.1